MPHKCGKCGKSTLVPDDFPFHHFARRCVHGPVRLPGPGGDLGDGYRAAEALQQRLVVGVVVQRGGQQELQRRPRRLLAPLPLVTLAAFLELKIPKSLSKIKE